MKLFNLISVDINTKSTWKIGENLTEDEVKEEFEKQEYLSKLFANGTYNVIEEVKEAK